MTKHSFLSRGRRIISSSELSSPTLVPTQHAVQWVPGVKWPWQEVDHSNFSLEQRSRMSELFGCSPECLFTMHRDNCTPAMIYTSRVTRNTVDLLEGGQEKQSCPSQKEFHDVTVRLPLCSTDTRNNSRSVSLPSWFCVTIICVTLCSCDRTFSHNYAMPFLVDQTGLLLPPSSSSSVCIIHILSLAHALVTPCHILTLIISTLKMEAACSSKMLEATYHIRQCRQHSVAKKSYFG